jgi:hypothetical protein
VTWGNGSTGVSGIVSDANSLVGSKPNDQVGQYGVIGLSNGNFLVLSPNWNSKRGAVTWTSSSGASGTVSEANSLVGSKPNDQVGQYGVNLLNNGNYVVLTPSWNGGRGAVTWGNGSTGVSGIVSDANSLVGSKPNDQVGQYGITRLNNGNYLVLSPNWDGQRGAVTWVSGTTGRTLDGKGVITPQNSLVGRAANAGLRYVALDPTTQSILAPFVTEGSGRVTVGLTDPNQFSYARGQSQTVTLTPDFLTGTLNTGTAVVLQASNDITIDDPIIVNAGGSGGALTLQAGRSIIINANISTDNGALTLIANDTLGNGVVDSQRERGNASIAMAGGTALDAGTEPLTVELRDGAGRTNTSSRSINLQTISAGSVTVVNRGPSAGSDVRLGGVTTSGPQIYSNPHGSTLVTADLRAGDSAITFTDSIVVSAAVKVGVGSSMINFAGSGTQRLQSGAGASFSNVAHNGSGTLQLKSALAVSGTLTQAAGIFDANGEAVTVEREALVTGGTYLASTAPQTFTGGLVVTDGTFTSSTAAMTVRGAVAVLGGLFSGEGALGTLTATAGTVAPGGTSPGILSVAEAVTFFSATTFRVLCNGATPGSAYSQLQASGPITLASSSLSLVFGFEPSVGSAFEILTNTGAGPITGTFNGLDEGRFFSQGGYQFQITYRGGTGGNSVVLTRLA